MKRIANATLVLIPGILALAFWEACTHDSAKARFLFGAPSLIWDKILNYGLTSNALFDVLTTLGEAAGGFVVGNVGGFLIGIGLAYWPRLQTVARPYVVALGSVPVFALAPVLIIWFGVGYSSKLALASFSTFLVALVQTYHGASGADRELIEMVESLGGSRRQVFRVVVLPSSATSLFLSLHLTVGVALLGAFIGELVSAERGLGYRILQFSGLYDIPGVLTGIVLIMLLALVLDGVVDLAALGLARWNPEIKSKTTT